MRSPPRRAAPPRPCARGDAARRAAAGRGRGLPARLRTPGIRAIPAARGTRARSRHAGRCSSSSDPLMKRSVRLWGLVQSVHSSPAARPAPTLRGRRTPLALFGTYMKSQMLIAALLAACAAPAAFTGEAPVQHTSTVPAAAEIATMAARFAPVTIAADTQRLSARDRQALAKLVEAAR